MYRGRYHQAWREAQPAGQRRVRNDPRLDPRPQLSGSLVRLPLRYVQCRQAPRRRRSTSSAGNQLQGHPWSTRTNMQRPTKSYVCKQTLGAHESSDEILRLHRPSILLGTSIAFKALDPPHYQKVDTTQVHYNRAVRLLPIRTTLDEVNSNPVLQRRSLQPINRPTVYTKMEWRDKPVLTDG